LPALPSRTEMPAGLLGITLTAARFKTRKRSGLSRYALPPLKSRRR
jgi:hypothetical protein